MNDIGGADPDVAALREDSTGFDTIKAYPGIVCDALNLITDGVLISNLEGKIVYANTVAASMFGRDREEIAGRKIGEVSTAERGSIAGFVEAVEEIHRWTGEIAVRRSAGKALTVKVSTHPLTDDTGTVIGSVASFTDVTYRRKLQERLARYEHLALLGQLTGGVAHELRNALGLIKGATHFLDESLGNPSSDVAKVLGILNAGVEKSDQIVKSLLTVARPTPASWREVDVNQVVQDALTGARIPKNVDVVIHLSPALPEIMGDGGQFNLVLDNLIRNAFQAMPNGGKLEVTTEAPDEEWIVVSVADTGMGISPEDQGRLFNPLFTKKSGGTGLGLALVRSLTEGHGGHVDLQSEVGKGSIFSIHLRRDAKPAQSNEPVW
jgi:PAS domain S-box-containing protein